MTYYQKMIDYGVGTLINCSFRPVGCRQGAGQLQFCIAAVQTDEADITDLCVVHKASLHMAQKETDAR